MTACTNCGFPNIQNSLEKLQYPAVDPWQQLSGIESDITRVESVLEQLVELRIRLKREINDRSAPILRFPREISEAIFVKFLEDSPVSTNTLPRLPPELPLLLGRICSTWRGIAWSMRRIWNVISLDLTETMDPMLVEQWLVRSGSLPLFVYAKCNVSRNNSPGIAAIMRVIARHSERWRTAEFELPFFCFDSLDSIKHRLPNLQRLIINKEKWPPYPPSLEMFSVAPQLWDVSFHGPTPCSIQIPASRLTKLAVECPYASACVEMLRQSPHIIHCDFYGIASSGNGTPSRQPEVQVLAEHLQTLQLGVHSEQISSVFDSLIIPAAQALRCHTSGCIFPSWNFLSLISRSSCILRTLSLSGFRISNDHLISCLRGVPSLSTLSLEYLTTSNELLEMLNPYHWSNFDADCLLPNLTSFEYTSEFDLDFSIATSLLVSRWNYHDEVFGNNLPTVVPLKAAVFTTEGFGHLDTELSAQLRPLVMDGMRIEFITADEYWA